MEAVEVVEYVEPDNVLGVWRRVYGDSFVVELLCGGAEDGDGLSVDCTPMGVFLG